MQPKSRSKARRIMAGYRTVDELMDILEEECLEFDAVVSIVGGNSQVTHD